MMSANKADAILEIPELECEMGGLLVTHNLVTNILVTNNLLTNILVTDILVTDILVT